jgi:hypothetical protein
MSANKLATEQHVVGSYYIPSWKILH